MNQSDLSLDAVTLALLGAATLFDLRQRRIPNLLTITGSLLGLILQAALAGWPGFQQATLGWLAGFALLLAPCLLRWVGAGDVKLLAAVGALQSPSVVLNAGLYGLIVGGFLSLAVLLRSRLAQPAGAASAPPRAIALPYAPALAIGAVLALALS